MEQFVSLDRRSGCFDFCFLGYDLEQPVLSIHRHLKDFELGPGADPVGGWCRWVEDVFLKFVQSLLGSHLNRG